MVSTSRDAPSGQARTDNSTVSWRDRATQVGWVVLPLRLFLGVTMVYAGFLKLSDRAYLDPNAAAGVANQMRLAKAHSPISALVGVTAQHAAFFGLLIALGELAVGLGVLFGIWTRLAAFGGMMLALSFFLTVSWTTRPYFFGSDIVFLFAFTPLLVGGDGKVLSVWAAIRRNARSNVGLTPDPGRAREPVDVVAAADRRAVLQTGGVALGAGLATITAATVARIFSSTPSAATVGSAGSPSRQPGSAAGSQPTANASTNSTAPATNQGTSGPQVPPGAVLLGPASAVRVGSAAQFTDPKTGQPGVVVQPKAGTYLAYSAVCTHQGCTVGFTGSQFACPCHGATYSATTGAVTGGPAPAPLARLNVVELGGKIYRV